MPKITIQIDDSIYPAMVADFAAATNYPDTVVKDKKTIPNPTSKEEWMQNVTASFVKATLVRYRSAQVAKSENAAFDAAKESGAISITTTAPVAVSKSKS